MPAAVEHKEIERIRMREVLFCLLKKHIFKEDIVNLLKNFQVNLLFFSLYISFLQVVTVFCILHILYNFYALCHNLPELDRIGCRTAGRGSSEVYGIGGQL